MIQVNREYFELRSGSAVDAVAVDAVAVDAVVLCWLLVVLLFIRCVVLPYLPLSYYCCILIMYRTV